MMNVQDHTGKLISVTQIPQRIVSLVPSQTELLFDLGLEDRIVGITKFCIHPDKGFRKKNKIGGTKNVNIEVVKALHPDLIIANKEENVKEQIEAMEKIAPVFTTNVIDVASALQMIEDIGVITNTLEVARGIIDKIKVTFSVPVFSKKYNALYLIWKNPFMAAGSDTFISHMLEYAGFTNIVSNSKRYPCLTQEDIIRLNPEIILLSSEPYPFKQKHIDEFKDICPRAKIILVNGEYFSWYGSRLLKAADYFTTIIN
jgi:ABC-type Fe3+-hydroxamate transport system substrate-binding protein